MKVIILLLIILLIGLVILTTLCVCIPKRTMDNYEHSQNKIFVAIRSYNRPEYLKRTLDSLANTDLTPISKLWIYDDGSTDKNTLDILKQHPITDKDITSVVLNTENKGCRYSYLDLLEAMFDAHKSGEYFCIIDNDVEFASDAFLYLNKSYEECRKVFPVETEFPVLLSGFCPTNSHKDSGNYLSTYITSNKYFKERYCVGAVCYMFDKPSYQTIYDGWISGDNDWGVCEHIKQKNGHMCVTSRTVVNHFGAIGENSNLTQPYDTDVHFMINPSIV